MSIDRTWQQMFLENDQIRLALKVRESGSFSTPSSIRAVADDQVRLMGGAGQAARLSKRANAESPEKPRVVIVTPEPEQSPSDFQALVSSARGEFPAAELAGFGPRDWLDKDGLFDRTVAKLGVVGHSFEQDSSLQGFLANGSYKKLTLVLVYTPEVTPVALEQAVESLAGVSKLVSVAALPLGAGDRIPLAGLTTAGTTDMMVLSALRHLLPPSVALRASWAALGWKVGQLSILHGANELTGWLATETAVYTGRVRAAARVENDELMAGIAEAGCTRREWLAEPVGAQ